MVYLLKNLSKVAKKESVKEIARRYFVINSFDGIIVALAILISAFLYFNFPKNLLIRTLIASAIGISLSGFFGAYFSESSERKFLIKKMEKALLRKLKGTIFEKESLYTAIYIALVDSLSPLIFVSTLILPLVLISNYYTALTASIVMAISEIGFLGYYLGKISKESKILSIFKLVLTAIILSIILLIVENIL